MKLDLYEQLNLDEKLAVTKLIASLLHKYSRLEKLGWTVNGEIVLFSAVIAGIPEELALEVIHMEALLYGYIVI